MSKTNNTSKLVTLDDYGALADCELGAVAGGIWFLGYPAQGAHPKLGKGAHIPEVTIE